MILGSDAQVEFQPNQDCAEARPRTSAQLGDAARGGSQAAATTGTEAHQHLHGLDTDAFNHWLERTIGQICGTQLKRRKVLDCMAKTQG